MPPEPAGQSPPLIEPPSELMPPAPRLPPALTVLTTPSEPTPADPDPDRVEPGRQCDVAAAALHAAIAAHHQRTTALHQEFLRQQGEFYDRLRPLLSAGEPNAAAPAVIDELLDPATDTWLADHCPTWTIPVLPAMSIADRLARAASDHIGRGVVAVRDVRVRRWLTLPGPVRLRTLVEGTPAEPTVTLSVWRDAKTAVLSRFEPVATGRVHLGDSRPRPPARFEPLADTAPAPSPYTTGEMFHGPSFQYLTSLRVGATGASGTLDLGRGRIPRGVLHPGPLDAAMHTIPGLNLWRWAPELEKGRFGFPHRIAALTVFEPLPDTGTIEVEARFAGFDDGNLERPVIDLQLCDGDRVLLEFRIVLALVRLGRFAQATPSQVRAFNRDRHYVGELLMSAVDGDTTVLRRDDVDAVDFIPGTVACLYRLPPMARGRDHLTRIAAKEHVARRAAVHPGLVDVDIDARIAWCAGRPGEIHRLDLAWTEDMASARDADAAGNMS